MIKANKENFDLNRRLLVKVIAGENMKFIVIPFINAFNLRRKKKYRPEQQ